MSGLGPAACWLAHKRIESWSRLAKERVGAVRKPAADKIDGSKSSIASTSLNMSTDSNNDSFASTEVNILSDIPPHHDEKTIEFEKKLGNLIFPFNFAFVAFASLFSLSVPIKWKF